jgi:hypothetical protein
MSVSSFNIGDVDHMLETALIDAKAGRNVYVETRTVRPGRPNERGKLEATTAVFALVIDCDADKGRGGHVNGDASAIVETSPGNSHRWLFLRRALGAAEAQALGIMIRKATGADHCTGVITQGGSPRARVVPRPITELDPETAKLIEDITIDAKGRAVPRLYSKAWANAELRKMLNISAKEAPRDITQLSDAELIETLARQAKELGVSIDLSYDFGPPTDDES